MSIEIGKYTFEGPFASTDDLKKQSGVYTILGRNSTTERWNVVDIGESQDVKERVESHDRKDCWKKQNYSILNVAVRYVGEAERKRIEQELRNQFNPPCGDR